MTAASTDKTSDGVFPSRAQVVIVGGGVIGCSVAYHLARLGWTDVLLLERQQLTSGTTWHAAGLITSAGMVDETSLWMSRYSRDLYAGLEAETGLSTGFRAIGHISLACNPPRLEALRRDAAWAHALGVEDIEIPAEEVSKLWPIADVDDVLAGFYVADEGRANPVDVAMSLAAGARARGVRIVEGVAVEDFTRSEHRVTGVVTDRGTVQAEYVVICAGMWARQLGARAGVDIPLQAAEHYYLLTEPMAGVHRDLPVIEDPDRYGYYREEGGGLLVGLFEPVAAAWNVDAIPRDFAFGTLPPDWERVGPYLEAAMDRVPSLSTAGIRTFFCGPESFTPDVRPMLGPAPDVDGLFVAAGLNSLGILLGGGVGSVVAQWIVDGVAPVDVTGYAVERALPHETSRRFRRERTVEQLGVLFGDAVWPSWQPGSARGIRRTALHDRFAAAGAHFGVSAGWEFPEWFAPTEGAEPSADSLDFAKPASFGAQRAEHETVRERVGILDMTLMAKFDVQGRDAATVLGRLSAGDIDRPVGRIVYTQWLNRLGGIEADLTVTRLGPDRFLVVASDVIHRRVQAMLRRETRPDEQCVVTDVTSGTALLSVQGPYSRELLSRLSPDDLSDAGLPYLSARQLEVDYGRFLVGRVTYVGELGYELHIPTELAVTIYDALIAAGSDLGIRPIGFGALNSLRLEKAYRDYGIDIDTTDNPLDAGLGFAVSFDKPGGFVGREALLERRAARAEPNSSGRRSMVQVLLDDPELLLFGNEPLVHQGRTVGYVRAAGYGHTLGAAVGLAMVEHPDGSGDEWLGAAGFEIRLPVGFAAATVSLRPAYDPERARVLA